MLIQALAADPRFAKLSDRKAVAVELLIKRIDAILEGDEYYPANWMRSADICRQEAGIAPFAILD